MKRAWVEQLEQFEPERVGAAVLACARDVKFPPTLPEFVDLVRSYHLPKPALPAPEPSPFVPHQPSQAELTAAREFPKSKNGLGTWWAKRILRLVELGAPPPHRSIEIACEVLGVQTAAELREREVTSR